MPERFSLEHVCISTQSHLFSRTFQNSSSNFPGFSKTKAWFQDFPSSWKLDILIPGLSRIFHDPYEPRIHDVLNAAPVQRRGAADHWPTSSVSAWRPQSLTPTTFCCDAAPAAAAASGDELTARSGTHNGRPGKPAAARRRLRCHPPPTSSAEWHQHTATRWHQSVGTMMSLQVADRPVRRAADRWLGQICRMFVSNFLRI